MRLDQTIDSGCAMGGLLITLTHPWTLHIMWLLHSNGPMRFGALRRGVAGISARVLTVRLRTLEKHGFVTRSVASTSPPEVTYSPTSRIEEMGAIMEQLGQLAARWQRDDALRERPGTPAGEAASTR
ncbi:helix-turn-helix domain-containing protein [Beijerinckia sp. L45]|uniref:winged helix-turn-helix transcriptional regulator n=1 Tax=Beijerinckia sp. L45 TaxID=1641855 RepID=UPI00131D0002|nr:helix-turn-helix domain-containing protein [Beijerinckia sp. L45]